MSEALYYYATGFGYPRPYANYTPAIIDPPADSDVVEDWQVFHELGRNMGLPLRVPPMFPSPDGVDDAIVLDGSSTPSLDELLDHLYRNSRVPLAEVRTRSALGGGAVYESEPVVVQPADDGWTGRLDVGNADMMNELADARQSAWPVDDRYPLRLVCRRIVGALNSSGRDLPNMARHTNNPAYLHPDDLAALGLTDGELVDIVSEVGTLLAVVAPDLQLRRGLVSMTHSFGDVPGGETDVRKVGSNTSWLTVVDRDYDRFTGMPRMSNVPVAIHRAGATQSSVSTASSLV